MNIIVLIKEVPDMERVRFDRARGVIDRISSEGEINPLDLWALQSAVDIKNRHGGCVTAMSMGPERSIASLRDAFARGADNCILLSDRRFAGSDTYATSRVLAGAISRMNPDLIICGEKTVDGDTAQVGAEVAELLDIPHSYYVESIDSMEDSGVVVTVSDICGSKQQRRMKLPALIAVNRSIAYPLLPALERKLESISLNVQKMGISELSGVVGENDAGLNGSPTKVSKIVIPDIVKRKGKIFQNDGSDNFINAFKTAVQRRPGHE
ncbi:MAG: electron transfer flavoprotein subunit beta/FixA family protein [Defluviitaleaceae bacterium]|nr:electron transfer flavoprotein subunit beta/FixA family protein [Defluviitaleaceae bacterium]